MTPERLRTDRRAVHATGARLLTKSSCPNPLPGVVSNRVLGATPGHPPASYHLSHTPPPIPKGRRGFCLSVQTMQNSPWVCSPVRIRAPCTPRKIRPSVGITAQRRCCTLRCWNLSSSSAAGTSAGKCAIKTGKWLRPEGRKPDRPPVIAPIARCSWCFLPAGRRPISNHPDRTDRAMPRRSGVRR
jgi:hypothetical protein